MAQTQTQTNKQTNKQFTEQEANQTMYKRWVRLKRKDNLLKCMSVVLVIKNVKSFELVYSAHE